MSGLGITDLSLPPDEWRVDLRSPGFETPEFAAREDAKRAGILRRRAMSLKGNRRFRMLALADKIDPTTTQDIPDTPASARYIREQRIRLIGWIWKAVVADMTGTVARFDVIKPSWAVDHNGLRKKDATKLRKEFREELNRAAKKVAPGGAADCRGFLVAVLHGEHERRSKLYQLHWHLIATGDWVSVVNHLRKVKAYAPTCRVKRPVRPRFKLTNLAYALTYLLKLYWPGKWRGKVSGTQTKRRNRKHLRISEPYHSEALLWLDRWKLNDLILVMNCRVGKDGLIVKSVHE